MIPQRTYSTLLKYSQNQSFKNTGNKLITQNFKKGVLGFMVGYAVSIFLIKNNFKYGLNGANSAEGTFWDAATMEPKYRDSLYWAGF